MNVTTKDFKALEEALALFPTGDDFASLPAEVQNIIVEADSVLVRLEKKRRASNKRTADYIAEKRRTDKNYARGKARKGA